jgi:Uma2 family endonuclease
MATMTPATRSGLVPYRLTVRQFRKMIDANIFTERDRVELLGGILVQMTVNQPHNYIVTRLAELLRPKLQAGWSLWEEKSVQLGRTWRPQPDITVLSSPTTAFARQPPKPRDIMLLVEVADTSYPKDSIAKLRQYARVRIPHYWIVHVDRRQVEVHSDPHGRGVAANYRDIKLYTEDVELPIVIDGRDLGSIPVKDILP